jgi:2-polyprenyl-3-methyl-5-hydroxy-6-metoxy-1,4-benzoquinol methylase
MPDDVKNIQAFYDNYAARESTRLERHQLERDVTWRYLDKYLPPGGNILEIGAATGAYTIPLARRGYDVTAVDLSPKLLEICQKRVAEEQLEEKVTCLAADARDLSKVRNRLFDAVLMMGPLYHLVEKEDRETALEEAYKKLKPGGKIFSTFISRYGIWGDVMKNIPHYIERQVDLKSVLAKGKDANVADFEFRGYFAKAKELVPLHKKAGFKKLALAGIEPAISADDESYNKLQGEHRRLWLDLFFSLSTEATIIGASRHLLYIGVKE